MTIPTISRAPLRCHAPELEDITEAVCETIVDVLTRVGDKWSLLVLHALSQRSLRFNELKRSLGTVSQKVLTATLRGLERDGYVAREVTPSVPPRVDYRLTELGHEVLVPVTALAKWALSRNDAMLAARVRFDRSRAELPAGPSPWPSLEEIGPSQAGSRDARALPRSPLSRPDDGEATPASGQPSHERAFAAHEVEKAGDRVHDRLHVSAHERREGNPLFSQTESGGARAARGSISSETR